MSKLPACFTPLAFALLSTASVAQDHAQVLLTPENAFAGHSVGNGTLEIFLGRRKSFRVESNGVVQPDGSFRLEQRVVFLGEPAQTRTWLIAQATGHRFSGTLSDAAGRVTGKTQGPRLTLQYRLKGPLVMHQTLELMADAKTIDNTGCITLIGIPVGHLHEIIERQGQ